jgi:hypothetical protein
VICTSNRLVTLNCWGADLTAKITKLREIGKGWNNKDGFAASQNPDTGKAAQTVGDLEALRKGEPQLFKTDSDYVRG